MSDDATPGRARKAAGLLNLEMFLVGALVFCGFLVGMTALA